MTQIVITVPGIKKALSRYNYVKAIFEFIWNGFDAKATSIELTYKANEIGFITNFAIKDNGYGIQKEKLKAKFVPFFESDREIDPDGPKLMNSAIHGKNGVGRLTFFCFANTATWNTVYDKEGKRYKYSITIDIDSLNTYTATESTETSEPVGTVVNFSGIKDMTSSNLDKDVLDHLKTEFGWFLELNKAKGYSIKVNGSNLDYSSLIRGLPEFFKLEHEKTPFDIKYVQWSERLDEYSRYYFINSNNDEIFKEFTTLNNKGDHFYHSVFIKSPLFDSFNFKAVVSEQQGVLLGFSKQSKEFKWLMNELEDFLRRKRKPFLKAYSDKLIDDLERNKAFANLNMANAWDRIRRKELDDIIRGLYQIEPKLFSDLNLEQKKTFVALLDLINDSGEKERLFSILEQIVELDAADRIQLFELLKTSSLSRIIATIKLIEDRYRVVSDLKSILFDKELHATEPNLQKLIEDHYWLFGEQYHLVTAAEPKFEEALRRFVYLLTGEKPKVKINHPDKNREMDIFAVRQDMGDNIIKSIVVELKNPDIKLGKIELDQVQNYFEVILSKPEFNGLNMFWEFYLVGNGFDNTGHIENYFENAKHHGKRSLVFKTQRHEIYVKLWSEILAEFEIRHKFLNDNLKLQRDKLSTSDNTAVRIVDHLHSNTAVQPPEAVIPKTHRSY